MRMVDLQYLSMCNCIMRDGTLDECRASWVEEDGSLTRAKTKSIFGVVNKYDLSEEFPLLGIKHVPFKSCIKELLWIWVKKSNKVSELGLKIWDQWADVDGTIGKAYGYQLGKKIQFPEGEMDQVDWILHQLKNNPSSRRMVTNIFNHEDLKDMGLQPCAYSITLGVKDGVLNCILNQRSQDVFVASGWNVAQYAVLVHMLAHVNNLKVGTLTHVIADAHIYDRHIHMMANGCNEFTRTFDITSECDSRLQLKIKDGITSFYDFTPDSFEIIGEYNVKPIKDIPVAK